MPPPPPARAQPLWPPPVVLVWPCPPPKGRRNQKTHPPCRRSRPRSGAAARTRQVKTRKWLFLLRPDLLVGARILGTALPTPNRPLDPNPHAPRPTDTSPCTEKCAPGAAKRFRPQRKQTGRRGRGVQNLGVGAGRIPKGPCGPHPQRQVETQGGPEGAPAARPQALGEAAAGPQR